MNILVSDFAAPLHQPIQNRKDVFDHNDEFKLDKYEKINR